jgi:hypothetical protein
MFGCALLRDTVALAPAAGVDAVTGSAAAATPTKLLLLLLLHPVWLLLPLLLMLLLSAAVGLCRERESREWEAAAYEAASHAGAAAAAMHLVANILLLVLLVWLLLWHHTGSMSGVNGRRLRRRVWLLAAAATHLNAYSIAGVTAIASTQGARAS